MPLTEEQVNAHIKLALDSYRSTVGDGIPLGHCLLLKEDLTMTMTALTPECFENSKSKSNIAMFLLISLLEVQGDAVSIFMMECWAAKTTSLKKLPTHLVDLPEDERGEALMCCVNQMGKAGKVMYQEFTRDAEGKLVFGKEKWDVVTSPRHRLNRFAFDLRLESLNEQLGLLAGTPETNLDGANPEQKVN